MLTEEQLDRRPDPGGRAGGGRGRRRRPGGAPGGRDRPAGRPGQQGPGVRGLLHRPAGAGLRRPRARRLQALLAQQPRRPARGRACRRCTPRAGRPRPVPGVQLDLAARRLHRGERGDPGGAGLAPADRLGRATRCPTRSPRIRSRSSSPPRPARSSSSTATCGTAAPATAPTARAARCTPTSPAAATASSSTSARTSGRRRWPGSARPPPTSSTCKVFRACPDRRRRDRGPDRRAQPARRRHRGASWWTPPADAEAARRRHQPAAARGARADRARPRPATGGDRHRHLRAGPLRPPRQPRSGANRAAAASATPGRSTPSTAASCR